MDKGLNLFMRFIRSVYKFYRRFFLKKGLCLFFFLVTFGCTAKPYEDVTSKLNPEILDLPQGDYRSVAWLKNDEIAFIYKLDEFGEREGNNRIALYSTRSSDLQDVVFPPVLEECFAAPSIFSDIHRLRNEQLGYAYHCSGNGVSGRLYTWDKETKNSYLIKEYDVPFPIGDFTYSPDMSQIIQHERIGAGMEDQLYRVYPGDDKMEQILTHFVRARAPAWSPDGSTIAFSGTEIYPSDTNDIRERWQITALLDYPWDLYFMDADGSNVRIILPQVGRPYQLKWSPDGNYLAYSGHRKDGLTGGIWILDIDSMELVRVWRNNSSYDWSLDGCSLVVIDRKKESEGVYSTTPHVLDISSVIDSCSEN